MKSALLVAHGSPSDPLPQEYALAALAQAVAAHLPDWHVGSATLAMPKALNRAVMMLGRPVIFPFFMASGWFTRKELPRRLAFAPDLPILPPFGDHPALRDLILSRAQNAAIQAGLEPHSTHLLLAAHGSQGARASKLAGDAMAEWLNAQNAFKAVSIGYVEEEPFLQQAATGLGKALCLPLFAMKAGHVLQDLPEALAAAEFAGPCLPPLIDAPETPALIARALRETAQPPAPKE